MLDRALTTHGPKAASSGRRAAAGGPSLRRDLGEDFAPPRARGVRAAAAADAFTGTDDDEPVYRPRRFSGLRFRLRGGVPRSVVGRVMAGSVVLAGFVGFTAVLWGARTLLLNNPRLVIESSSAIQITGNAHLSRGQLLSVFGEDVDRNILTVPLAERRAQLERLPWVEHATVMRLLPNRFRVAIRERTPVAFVRQGGTIGLVDASGVLLDMESGTDPGTNAGMETGIDMGVAPGTEPERGPANAKAAETHYSFPVVTGISAQEPLSTRSARMKLYQRFTADLDAGTDKISKKLSEVDLSNPEDVKALIPDGQTDVLVHFGDRNFLQRYEMYEKNLAGWKVTYPRLASADMRYERQVVLEMAPGAAVPAEEGAAPAAEGLALAKASVKKAGLPAQSRKVIPAVHAPAAKAVSAKPVPAVIPPAKPHLQTAFAVHAKAGDTAPKTAAKAKARQ